MGHHNDEAPNNLTALWSLRTTPARGKHWVKERNINPDDAEQWLTVFQEDEPNVAFVVQKKRPTIK